MAVGAGVLMLFRPRITSIPSYDRLIKLGSERRGAILLDVGCCFGTDIRKVAADGWPAENILATDIEPRFWELGHRLFCSTADAFPASFVPGDIFDPSHLDPASDDDGTMPPLRSLTSLTPLRGHIAAIHAGAFFHLFSEDRQTALAHALATLLSREPGSMIVGWHSGSPHKGVRVISRAPDHIPRAVTSIVEPLPGSQFCHSPESWAELWDGRVFERGSVKVESSLVKPDGVSEDFPDFYALYWSVTRL